jgi:hypothetical protein
MEFHLDAFEYKKLEERPLDEVEEEDGIALVRGGSIAG